LELRGHVSFICIYGEVYQGPLLEVEEEVVGVPVELVLLDGILPALVRKLVLEFDGDDRDAIHGKNDIDAVLMLCGVSDLPGDGQDICLIALQSLWVHTRGRGEEGSIECPTEALEAVSKDIQGAFMLRVQGPHKIVDKNLGSARLVDIGEVVPVFRLGSLHEVYENLAVDAEFSVEMGMKALLVVLVVDEVVFNGGLEGGFVEVAHFLLPFAFVGSTSIVFLISPIALGLTSIFSTVKGFSES